MVTQQPDRRDLPERTQTRDDAFALFYAKYHSVAMAALQMALSGTGADLDDVASRMWVQIFQSWCDHGPLVEAPRAFVRRCARNAAVDALRARTDLLVETEELDNLASRQVTGHGTTPEPELERQTHPGPDPSAKEDLLTNPQLIAALKELTPRQRSVVLTWIETFPPPTSGEIAEKLEIRSATTVRVHLMRAIKKLRDTVDSPALSGRWSDD